MGSHIGFDSLHSPLKFVLRSLFPTSPRKNRRREIDIPGR